MIKIEQTFDDKLVHKIITHPKLWQLTSGQGKDSSKYSVDPSFKYLTIYDDELIGCFQIRELTKILVECHISILPKFWGKDVALKASLKGFEWLRDNTEYYKAFTDVPKVCGHVISLCKKIGWEPCGLIREGCVYNNELVDLILFNYPLYKKVD